MILQNVVSQPKWWFFLYESYNDGEQQEQEQGHNDIIQIHHAHALELLNAIGGDCDQRL